MVAARLGSFALGILFAFGAASLAAQDAVRLVRVPDVVVLPAPPGTNLIVEVETEPDHPGIWLVGEDATKRLPFAAAGAGRWQVNLADPVVAELLGEAPRGQLFAGSLLPMPNLRSAPIEWSRTPPPPFGLSCRAQLQGADSVLASVYQVEIVEVARLSALEVVLGTAPSAVARLRCGADEVTLAPVTGEARLRLVVDADLRDRLVASGSFAVEVDLPTVRHAYRFATPPRQLDATRLGERFTVRQRTSATVPGSREFVVVAIDDITAGQATLSLRDPGRGWLASPRSVFQGDWLEFSLAGGSYVLVVDRLVNLVFGEDLAQLRVVAAADFVPDPIAVLIRRVAASEDSFVRGGIATPGGITARLLAAQCAAEHVGGLSLDHFVDEVASRSRKDKSEHKVVRSDGSEVTMREWLREELRAFEAEQKSKR